MLLFSHLQSFFHSQDILPFYSQNYPFIFPELPFQFSELHLKALLFPGITLLFSRSAFLFLKNALLFSRITLQFSRSPFFLFIVHIFLQEFFFPADCNFSFSYTELLREIIFVLLFYCFLFELFIDQFIITCILRPTNASYNDQEATFLGRSIIEHADENVFVNINAIRHGSNQKNHPQLV